MDQEFENVVSFHGHLCIDIALGYRVAKAALRDLSCQRPKDEELVAVVETDACAVDAIQAVTGCTFGKGNLIHQPHGKAAYTFYDRRSNKALRIYCHFWKTFDEGEGINFMRQMNKVLSGEAGPDEAKKFQEYMGVLSQRILTAPEKELFSITLVNQEPPSSARIFQSKSCHGCGEWTMETRLSQKEGKAFCPACL